MKILHFADLHIGVENYGRTDPNTGLSTRLGDFLDTYDELVDFAIEEEMDLVLFCGDAYKSRDPSQTHQREFAKRISRLSRAGIPTFLLVGNHDSPQVVTQATALEIFPTLDVDNVYIGGRMGTQTVKTNDGPLQIVALPWIRRSEFLSGAKTRGMTHQEINESIEASLVNAIEHLAENLDPSIPSVFAGHVTIGQSTLASEQSMMLGHDHTLFTSQVALKQFDYVALGHIHRHQILSESPYVVYSGSLQRVDFGEEKDPKGFCVVDIDKSSPVGERLREFKFVENKARKFLTIDVTVEQDDVDPTKTVIEAIEREEIADAIIRLRIVIPSHMEPLFIEPKVRESLSPAYYVAAISKEVPDRARTRIQQSDTTTLSPAEALKLYCETRNIPEDRAKLLQEYADELMEQEGAQNIFPTRIH